MNLTLTPPRRVSKKKVNTLIEALTGNGCETKILLDSKGKMDEIKVTVPKWKGMTDSEILGRGAMIGTAFAVMFDL